MKSQIINKMYKRIALSFSICLLIIWSILGTSASLAWFSDTSPEINNIFHFADFNITVSHLSSTGKWVPVDSQTKIFDEKALYEPGYMQIVYLKVENKGDSDFKFYTAVNVNGCSVATNVFGQQFMLQDYLKFGILTADREDDIKNSINNRLDAKKIANEPLHRYYETGAFQLSPNAIKYIILIVCLPDEVDNFANYRGTNIPKVELGITVKADQIKN